MMKKPTIQLNVNLQDLVILKFALDEYGKKYKDSPQFQNINKNVNDLLEATFAPSI